MKIIGKKINLRTLKDSDAQSIADNAKYKCVSRFLSRMPYPYKLQNAIDYLNKIKTKKDTDLILGIEDKNTHQIIGWISLEKINKQNKSGVLGYWLGKDYWGRGIMTEAVNLVINHAFKNLKLERIQASVMHPNIASMNILLKSGFKLEGILRKKVFKDKKWMDIFLFGLLKEDYKNNQLRTTHLPIDWKADS